MSQSPYEQLEQEWRRLHAFHGALALLRWDAAVMMPRGSAEVRGEQLAALETEYHALLTTPKITRLLDRAQANAQAMEDWQLANLREMRRARDHAIATPVSLISRLARATSRAEVLWAEARRQGNFELFAPLSRGSRAAGARQGRAARAGARTAALRRTDRRVLPGRGHAPTSRRSSRRSRAACRR